MKLGKFLKRFLAGGRKEQSNSFLKKFGACGRMASKQTKADTKPAGGGSPTPKAQSQTVIQPSSQQAQSQKGETDDLRTFIAQMLSKQKEELKQEIHQIKDVMQQKYDKVSQDMMTVVNGLSEVILQTDKKVEELNEEVQTKFEKVEHKFSEADSRAQRLENEVTMIQFRHMEFAIRLRGIKEENREDLRRRCSEALAYMLKKPVEMIVDKIDKIYRVNSWMARQRNLPRDVVIYFTDRRLRNEIIQASFVTTIQFDGLEVGVFKELPPKMLKDRKEFGFLVKELKKQNIQFRWDAPVGIILRYQDKRYRLNTLEKAEEFYYQIAKEGPKSPYTSSVVELKETLEGQQCEQDSLQMCKQREMEELEVQGAVGGLLDEPLLELSPELPFGCPQSTSEVALDTFVLSEPKDRRITRAVSKKMKEKEAQQGKQLLYSEAVGGAKRKISMTEQKLQQVRLSLQAAPNGS